MIDPRKIRIACISDSPKVTTGFGIVAKMLYQSFMDYGFDISVLGLLDIAPDENNELPYPFTPVSPMNLMGHNIVNGQLMYSLFLRRHRPDLIFILTSPGNAKDFVNGIFDGRTADYTRNGKAFTPPVLLYTPVEGKPQHSDHGAVFAKVQALGGKVVLYCESAVKQMKEEFPEIDYDYVNHGHDHVEWERYSEEDRKLLRKMVGVDDYFVVGAVGTNKRTKNWPCLIYAAKHLRDIGQDKGVLFYCHTDEKHSYMEGTDLGDLATAYGVRDMFLFKPDDMIYRNHPYLGTEYLNGTMKQVRETKDKMPTNKIERAYLFGHYDLVSRYNIMDMYVDVSQVEGWGLPPAEAMMCGIPTMSVHDDAVRSEIHSEGAFMINPIEERFWETWHTGSRLLQIDPQKVAETILMVKNSTKEWRDDLSKIGQTEMGKYKWAEQGLKMSQIAHAIVEKDQRR
jgi:glycosyltransferase involved in cell wall biosynthesis